MSAGRAASSACVWVFHAGALGDFVLTWPLLRALARGVAPGESVCVVADGDKARLAARRLGPGNLVACDANQRRFTRLWTGDAPPEEDRYPGVGRVVSFVADDSDDAGRRWLRAAAAMFPGAEIQAAGAPGTASCASLWSRHRVAALGGVQARCNPGGPIVVHVGAASREKMWPLDRWEALIVRLRRRSEVDVLAGEVEAERFDGDQLALLRSVGGRTILSLEELAETLLRASLFIGADTGPTHLAAQLGLPTLALFGPTDPAIWAPVGPLVTLVAPPAPVPMTWLATDEVEAATALLHTRLHAPTASLALPRPA